MSREAIIRVVNPYELHGVPYYQLLFSFLDEGEAVREARVAHDIIYPNPQEGDEVLIDSVLSIVSGVRKKT